MHTIRFDPLEELRPLLARELEEAPWEDQGEQTSQPLCFDAYRIGDDLHIDFDVPGVQPELVDVSVENHILNVSIVRELPSEGVDVIERGRVHGRFKRSVLLPAFWNVDNLTANVENGVLSIRAPWTPSTTKRSVTVSSSNAATKPQVTANSDQNGENENSRDWSAA